MRINKLKKQKGMTMIELVVSLGILIIGITSSLGLMASTINFAQESEKTVVVTSLARQGIEMLRVIRDYGKTLSENSFDNLQNGTYVINKLETGVFELSEIENPGEISECNNCQLYLNSAGQYVHSLVENAETIYKRWVKIESGGSNDEKKIVSQVYWTRKNKEHTYELETYLTNW